MLRRSIRAEAKEIFEKLKSAQEYRNGFASEKLRIIGRLLAIKHELRAFAQAPDHSSAQIKGFFTEHCARFSSQLPQNTQKAQYISETIINYFKEYGLSNPDYLWLNIRGKHITLMGIGEVKSHPASIVHKPDQLLFQESNIHRLMKQGDIGLLVSKRYRVTLSETFARYLILPRSFNAPHTLPAFVPLGWEIKEIEFTLPEIIFLKKLLLADIPHHHSLCESVASYSSESYRSFVRDMLKRVEEVIMEFFHDLLPLHDQGIRHALMMWSLLYHSIPTERESIETVITWAEGLQQNSSSALSLLSTPPLLLVALDEKESISYDAITTGWIVPDSITLAHALLSRLREIRKEFPIPLELSHKQEINIFTLL